MGIDLSGALEEARALLDSVSEEEREEIIVNELRRKISKAPNLAKSVEQIMEEAKNILPEATDDQLEDLMSMLASYINAQVPMFFKASDQAGQAVLAIGHVFMVGAFWRELKEPLRMAE